MKTPAYNTVLLAKFSPIKSVTFVYKSPQMQLGVNVVASTEGEIFVLYKGNGDQRAAKSIWIFNTDRTVRVQQKRQFRPFNAPCSYCAYILLNCKWNLVPPSWESIIPVVLHGEDKRNRAAVNQGTELSFFTPDPSLQGRNTIPTTFVTYVFHNYDGNLILHPSCGLSNDRGYGRLSQIPGGSLWLESTSNSGHI